MSAPSAAIVVLILTTLPRQIFIHSGSSSAAKDVSGAGIVGARGSPTAPRAAWRPAVAPAAPAPFHVGVRQRVAEIEGEPGFFPGADHALDQQLQHPRFGRIEGEFRRHHEQRNFGKLRRAFGCKASQPCVVAVAEADAVGVLDQFDAVEDSAADVGRPLEGIATRSRDNERLLAGLEPAGQAVESVLAEQAAADGRHGNVSDVEVDEGVARIALFRMRGRGGVARFFEGLVDVVNGKDQAANGTVTDQALPVANFALAGIDRLCEPAAPRWRPRCPDRRADRS